VLILDNATLVDLKTGDLRPGQFISIEGDSIVAVDERRPASSAAERIDLAGRCLLPGLIDAHFHATLTDTNPANLRDVPTTLMTARAAGLLQGALERGFTTVRDMGGADWGIRSAVAEGSIKGPRVYIAGRALSQTGGHGDLRRRTDSEFCNCGSALAFMSVVADGKAGVQVATRELLRQGVDHIKVFLSGGVVSPSDPLASAQYTDEELEAIVREARSWNTYVAAHAYTAAAITRAAKAGVRTIEHGNLIDEPAARLLADRGGYLVPTLVTYEVMRREAPRAKLPAFSVAKLETVLAAGLESIQIAISAGVKLGFGTDLLGEFHAYQAEELQIRARVQEPRAVLASATLVNAEILGQTGRLGTIAPGAAADLIAVNGNPLEDLGLLQSQGRHLALIMKNGAIYKRAL
jgi:imidazolonepropionase-like amidohydrolase